MRYYIDTNTLVFYIQDTLDYNAIRLIDDYCNSIYISSIAVTEFIHLIQYNRIKLKNKIIPSTAVNFIKDTLGIEIKYTNSSHLNTFSNLPSFVDHTDPNDKLIIAQAITDKITLISTDTKFPMYERYGLQLVKATH